MDEKHFEALMQKAEEERSRAVTLAENKYRQDVEAIRRVWELAKDLGPVSESAPPPARKAPLPLRLNRPRPPMRVSLGEIMASQGQARRANTLKGALLKVATPGETVAAQDLFELLPPEIAAGTNVASVSATVGKLATDGEGFELVERGSGGKPSLYRVLERKSEPARLESDEPENGPMTQE